MKTFSPAALLVTFIFVRPTSAQVAATPSSKGSGRIQNIAPQEVWKRVTQCVFPTYPGFAFRAGIAGVVDIGLGISPKGDVDNYRVLAGHPLLAPAAVDAIRQWKFRPNVARGEVTWSRVRALVHFNADGTTAVDLSPGLRADDFGDPGTTRSVGDEFPRPTGTPECKSVQPWTGAEAKEIEASEVSPGSYKNNYFGLTFHFPLEWRVGDRDTLDSIDENRKRASQSHVGALPTNVKISVFPSYLLFLARTDGPPIGSSGSSVQIWAEKEAFISSADRYFPNSQFLIDKTAEGTRGPVEVEISGTKYYRGDRWGKVEGLSIYEVRFVTYARDLILAIDIHAESSADSAAIAEQLVKSLEGISFHINAHGATTTDSSTSPSDLGSKYPEMKNPLHELNPGPAPNAAQQVGGDSTAPRPIYAPNPEYAEKPERLNCRVR